MLYLCDIFCFPSHREGFGYSIIEASALEKPIICSNIYGLKYTCIDHETGLKHKVKSTKSLLDKMTYAINEPEVMKQMGKKGRVFVNENFSEAKVLKKWNEFYFMLKYVLYYFTCWKIRTISSLQSHTFFIYCAIS